MAEEAKATSEAVMEQLGGIDGESLGSEVVNVGDELTCDHDSKTTTRDLRHEHVL